MADTQTESTSRRDMGVAVAIGLSAAFVVLAFVVSPVVSAAVVVPASVAAGGWRAHTMPRRNPHSLSVPVFSPTAVVHAPRVSAPSSPASVNTAA